MTYCEHCGQPLAPGTAECPVCHTPNFQGCTAQQNAQSQSAPYGQQAYNQPQGDPYGQQAHTIRSREISASIILQSKSQLKALYRDNASTIEGNCDTTLFLGGKEKDTLKDLAEILGKETIDLYNISDTRGTSQSYGLNYQKTGKELMSQDEIAVMDGSKCIMQLRGVRPFFSDKFDITKHKQYPMLSDYDKKNEFDIEKYVKNRNKLRFKR